MAKEPNDPKDITVFLGEDQKTLPDGEYTMEQLVQRWELPAGYVLSVRHGQGKLEPMEPGVPLKLHPNMHFIAQPPDGNWA